MYPLIAALPLPSKRDRSDSFLPVLIKLFKENIMAKTTAQSPTVGTHVFRLCFPNKDMIKKSLKFSPRPTYTIPEFYKATISLIQNLMQIKPIIPLRPLEQAIPTHHFFLNLNPINPLKFNKFAHHIR